MNILIRTIKADRPISGQLIQENRPQLIEHLTRHYDAELAQRLEKKSPTHY